ncbi:MAG: DUF1656 domain-containing protein [Gammaproteobacteria bacterium]
MSEIPVEIAISEVYFSPLLFAVSLAIVLAIIAGRLLNRYRLSRYFFYPPLVFICLIVIFTGLISYSGLVTPWYAG